MTIAEQFATRYAALNTDRNDPAYDDAAVMRFEQDIHEAAHLIPVDPEDEHCTEYVYVFEDGSAIDASDDMKVATPDAVKELQELQRQWQQFRTEWFLDHPSYDRRSVFDRMECAAEFRKSVLDVSGD